MNLASAFAASVEKRREKIAIYWGEKEFSYAAVFGQVCAVAAELAGKLGVKPGDRVALWVKNCPEFVPAVFGILSAGGVVVPINNFLKPAEVSYILNDSGANVVITDAELGAHFPELAAARPSLKMLKVEEFAGQGSTESRPTGSEIANRKSQIVDRTESDLAALLYTSGTTGHPKGAMLTHGNFLHNVASCVEALKVQEDERVMVALPQFHSFMFTVGTLLPMVVRRRDFAAENAASVQVRCWRTSRGIGARFCRRCRHFTARCWRCRSSASLPLRLCISGGAPLPVEVFNEFTRRFPFPLREGYGPTESSPVATVNPIYGVNKPGSIGKPIPNVELSIRDEAGKELPVGDTGEICIRGGNVMLRLLESAGRDGEGFARRLALHRRRGLSRRRRLLFHHRPQEGHAAGQRHQCLSA